MKNALFSNDVAVTNLCLISIVIGMIVFIILRYIKESRECSESDIKKLRIVAISALAVYLIIVFYATLACRSQYETTRSTKIFATFINAYWGVRSARNDVIQNLLFFMPFGFLLQFLSEKKIYRYFAIPIMCLYSCCIEATQYVTKLGVCQVDDIICNTISGAIGFGLASLFTLIIVRICGNDSKEII